MKQKVSRRQVLRLMLSSAATVGVSACGGLQYATRIEPHWLALERVEVPIADLPAHLDGFTIVQLSDLHRGPEVTRTDIAQAVDLARQQKTDLVTLTGDYVSGSASYATSCAKALAPLAETSHVVACLGNHDHWTDAHAIAGALVRTGIDVMRNTAREVAEGLRVAAVHDVWEDYADLERALENVPRGATVVLLAHEPDYADAAAADGRMDLQLSGHSHEGQVRMPFLGPPITPYLAEKYKVGLYRVGTIWLLYVNRGVGLIAPAARFNCRSEVTRLTLRRPIS